MLHKYFEKTFLINLDSRKDRLEKSMEVCKSVGLEFERYPAIVGSELQDYYEYEKYYSDRIRWNTGAAGLAQTTYNIVKEAMEKKYSSILIMEDDVEFRPELKLFVETAMEHIPEDWEMFYFGATHHEPYELIGPFLAKLRNANACHCYAIHSRAFERVLKILSPVGLPIDYAFRLMMHPRGKSYCTVPNVAYQFSGYSDIEGGFLDTTFLKAF